MPRQYQQGELVDVSKKQRKGRPDSEGGRAVIQGISQLPDKYHVQYKGINHNKLSQDVSVRRLEIAQIDTLARKSTRHNRVTRPSLISSNRVALIPMSDDDINFNFAAPTIKTGSVQWMLKACSKGKQGACGVLDFLEKKMKKGGIAKKGWLRKMTRKNPNNNKHLTAQEKEDVALLYYALQSTAMDTVTRLLGYAWGTSPRTVRNIIQKKSTSGTLARKVRVDKGSTIFNDDNKRKQTFTTRAAHSRTMRAASKPEKLTTQQVNEAYNNLTRAEREEVEKKAADWQQRAPFLESEVRRSLLATHGSITWRQLANVLSGGDQAHIVSPKTLRQHVMSLPNSTYKTSRILPKLAKHHKIKRMEWAIAFWTFWESAQRFHRVQIVLVHMDEKWFYSIVVRKNNKRVPIWGVFPVSHAVQHKSHLGKVLCLASSGIIPRNNDISQGGQAILVSFDRAGRMEKADKTTYKREYKDDGTYHYPKLEGNESRIKGQEYFKPMEITGSSEGSTDSPKFALLNWFRDCEFPRLDAIAQKFEVENPGTTVKVIYQMDGAGPHRDKKFNDFLDSEFRVRDWLELKQPSQSPILNVHDACVFPSMSKRVSAAQGMRHGSHVMSEENTWKLAKKCWNEFDLETLARSFVGHVQMVNAVASCGGGDEFVSKKGLTANVRKNCIPLQEDGKIVGVEVLETLDETNLDGFAYPRHPERDMKLLTETQLQWMCDYLLPEDESIVAAAAVLEERWEAEGLYG